MKKFLSIMSMSMSMSMSLQAQTIADVSDLTAIQVTTPDVGTINAGSVKDVMANYPTLRNAIRDALVAKLESEDEASAKRRLERLEQLGVNVPNAAKNKVEKRLKDLADKKAAALEKKIDESQAAHDPAKKAEGIDRANAKLAEYLAAGIPISQAVQDKVRAALPAPPSPTPSPEPTPDDGL